MFLHLNCVRLWGHAGSDVETTYHSLSHIQEVEAQDPLLKNARRLVEHGAATPATLQEILRTTRERVRAAAEEAARRPKLSTREEVMAPIAIEEPERWRRGAAGKPPADTRARIFGDALPEKATAPSKRTLAAHINAALKDEMGRRPRLVVFGEDVGLKGGVYHVTAGLQRTFGQARVFDTLLDETTILGVAQGAAQAGLLPVPEIQYLAYVHNAIDQLRGEAATLSFSATVSSRTRWSCASRRSRTRRGSAATSTTTTRSARCSTSRGSCSRHRRAATTRPRCCGVRLRWRASRGRVVCFLEPIALYHEKDLHEPDDGGWLFDYPPPGLALLPGEVGVHHRDATDLLIVSYANGLRLSLRAAKRLQDEHDIRARVLDLRWLKPIAHDAIREHAIACGKVLVADECRATGGGVADAIIARLVEGGYAGAMSTVRSADSFIPLGPSTAAILLQEDQILHAARELCS